MNIVLHCVQYHLDISRVNVVIWNVAVFEKTSAWTRFKWRNPEWKEKENEVDSCKQKP
jgi:hypothetical protein